MSTGVDVFPGVHPVLRVDGLRLGIRSRGAWLALSQEQRWFGPGRHGALLYSDNAAPLPGIDVGGTGRLPKRAGVLGRFSGRLLLGFVPGARRDVDRPGWLMLDLRWQPVPWVELGAQRNSVFGGVGRPVDVGQVMLPTAPHVEGDPNQLLPDTDERASLDLRVSAPVGQWGVPGIDTLEAYVQHGGEDVIGRSLGPFPVPSLAGVANLYGVGVYAGPCVLQAELAVLRDDVFRWYVGHRVYHEGWTVDGLSLGHPSGGDSQTASLRGAWVGRDVVADVSWRRVARLEVLDRVDATVFVNPNVEVRHVVSASVTRLGARGRSVTGSVWVRHTDNAAFVESYDRWEAGAGVRWSPGMLSTALRGLGDRGDAR